ncbi:MAG: adenylate kinase [Clostridiales bacterium]|nr:adenylate kinase [Clostridiales bacterium]
MKLIFLGPPGAGKGTQAVKIAERFGIAHISTGDMLRAEMREGTELGNAAKDLIERGELVPDDVILGMVKNRIRQDDCKNGFLFDGFPRTIAQAEALEAISPIDHVINLEVPVERLISRISGRRMCPDCGAAYHVSKHPDARCDCGSTLYQREDDKEETVRNRLVVYERSTKPLIEYYANKGLLHSVNGDADVDVVDAEIRAVISK